MAYLGRQPTIGSQKIIDSFDSQFDGIKTSFDLRFNGNPVYPTLSASLILSLGGVLQEPGTAYVVNSDTIVFASAPPSGIECWALLYSEFGSPQSSGHAQLQGLANDDHTQYLHESIDRTGVTANIETTGTIASPIMMNPQNVSVDQTVPAGYNANSWGPITIDNGVTVTVSNGATWAVS